jgi:hypothetical protein
MYNINPWMLSYWALTRAYMKQMDDDITERLERCDKLLLESRERFKNEKEEVKENH